MSDEATKKVISCNDGGYSKIGERQVDDINDEVAKSKVFGPGVYTPKLKRAEDGAWVDGEDDEDEVLEPA